MWKGHDVRKRYVKEGTDPDLLFFSHLKWALCTSQQSCFSLPSTLPCDQFTLSPLFNHQHSFISYSLTKWMQLEENLHMILITYKIYLYLCKYSIFPTVRKLEQEKRSPKWQWLKDKQGKSPQKQNKGRSEDQSEAVR